MEEKTTNKKQTTKKEAKPKVEQKIEFVQERKKRQLDELIEVVSLVPNPLNYASKIQMGFVVEWEGYGDKQWIEYKELMNMKGTQIAFFKNNWIICDAEVLEDLKVNQFYKNMIDLEQIENIFSNSVEEIEQILKVSSESVKQLIFDTALNKFKDGSLDSVKVITMLKEKFDYDLELVK